MHEIKPLISLDKNPAFNHIYTSLPFYIAALSLKPLEKVWNHSSEWITDPSDQFPNFTIPWIFTWSLFAYMAWQHACFSLYYISPWVCHTCNFLSPARSFHNSVLLQCFVMFYPLSYFSWSYKGALVSEQPDYFLSQSCWSIGTIIYVSHTHLCACSSAR